MQHFLHQADGVATGSAAPAAVLVLLEGQRRGMIAMERAQSLMVLNFYSQALRHTLAGE
jgi:hypothetical protein